MNVISIKIHYTEPSLKVYGYTRYFYYIPKSDEVKSNTFHNKTYLGIAFEYLDFNLFWFRDNKL